MYFFLLVANFLVALVTSNGGASAIWRSIYQQHAVGFQSLSSAAPSYFQLGDDGEEASPSSSTVFGDVQPGSSPSADPSSSSSEISDDSRPGSPSRIDDDYEQLVSVVVGPGCHRQRLRRRGADRSSPGAVNGDFSKSFEPVWSGASTFQIVQEACQDAGQSWKEGPKDGGFPAYTTLSRNSSTWKYSFDQDGRRRQSASSLERLRCFLTVSHAEFVGNFSRREEHASCLSTGNSSGGGNSTFSLREIPAELLEEMFYENDECCFAILPQTKYDDFGGAENLDDKVGTGDEAKKLPPIEQLDEEIEANLHEETLKQEIRKNSGSFTKTVLFAIFVLSIPSFGVVLASAAKNAYEFLFFLEFCGSFGFRFHLGPVKVHFSFSYCIYGPGIDTESLDE